MKRHLTGTEVAELLGVKPNTVRAWRWRGQGPPFHQPAGKGSQATYDPDVIKMWLTMNKEGIRRGNQAGGRQPEAGTA
jgi:phage terminase Nu1 subunit (DNA packaging protein)